MEDETKNSRAGLIAGIVLVALLAGAAGFLVGRSRLRIPREERSQAGAGERSSAESEGGADVSGAVLTGGNAIAVNDQTPGATVMVSFVPLAQSGWVAIHEEADAKPGRIIGARRFDAGANQSGAVELLRPTEEGRVYFAMLHADDGDRQFDHAKDLPITDPQGNSILMRFIASAAPAEGR